VEIITKIFSNGFMLFIPILLFNVVLAKYLPPAYEMKSFNTNIPKLISMGELIGRVCVFGLPLFLSLNYSSASIKPGLALFIIGVLIYFSSWIALILFPDSLWSKSFIGFTAPAYTPIIWLAGFALLADSFYFKISYDKLYYIIPSVFMILFHFSHALFVWFREYR
jgi:hypothetical protein